MDVDWGLTDQEKKFLGRAARRRRLFLLSSITTVVVAGTILVYHGLILRDMNSPRFVIVLLLLLSGRSYLRLYKSATIFRKLQPGPTPDRRRD
jgi:hypothetical protein